MPLGNPNNLTVDQIVAACESWEAWGKQFGWECYGCDDIDGASFHHPRQEESFYISKAAREDIDRFITTCRQMSG